MGTGSTTSSFSLSPLVGFGATSGFGLLLFLTSSRRLSCSAAVGWLLVGGAEDCWSRPSPPSTPSYLLSSLLTTGDCLELVSSSFLSPLPVLIISSSVGEGRTLTLSFSIFGSVFSSLWGLCFGAGFFGAGLAGLPLYLTGVKVSLTSFIKFTISSI